MNTKILTQAQAEAIYSAMRALNNVGAKASEIDIRVDQLLRITVYQRFDHSILVCELGVGHDDREDYPDQSAFATAYGLPA